VSTARRYHAAIHTADTRYTLEVREDERTGKRVLTLCKDDEVLAVVPDA
jgi:hypothetical protein